MEYSELEQIKKELGIKELDISKIREELKRNLAKYHPDKTGGDFGHNEDKEIFLKIKEAIEFIDDDASEKTSIQVREVSELINAINDLKTLNRTEDRKEILFNNVNSSMVTYRLKNRLPKIMSSTISGVLTSLWAFPTVAIKHPIFKNFIEYNYMQFTIIWLTVLCYTCVLWYFLKINEETYNNFLKMIKRENYQNALFDNFIRYRITKDVEEENSLEYDFTKDEFIEHIDFYLKVDIKQDRKNVLFMLKYDIDVIESLADLILERAVQNNIVEINRNNSLSERYVLKHKD